jgi:hypothetical protein
MNIPCKDCLVFPMCRTRCQVINSRYHICGLNIGELSDNCKIFYTWWTKDWTNEKSTELEKLYGAPWLVK